MKDIRRSGAWARVWLLALLFASALAAAPRDLVLVLDNSGSMRGNDSGFLIREAVSGFVDRLPDGDRVAMVIFDHRVNLAVPLTRLDAQSRPGVLGALEQIDYRGRYTDSPGAVERALYELKSNGRPQARKSIVFLTDGIVDTGDPERDRESSAWLRRELADDAARHGIQVFGVAFTEAADLRLIQSLAVRTGGDYFRAPDAPALAPALQRIGDALVPATTEPPQPLPPPDTVGTASAPGTGSADETPPASAAESPPGEIPELPSAAGVELPVTIPDATQAARESARIPPAQEPAVAAPVATDPPHSSVAGEPAVPAGKRSAPLWREVKVNQLDYLLVAVGILAGILLLALILVLFLRRRRVVADTREPDAGTSPVRAFLDDLDGATGKLRHELTAERITLGRGLHGDQPGGQHIQIPFDTISRLHGSIEHTHGVWWAVDHGSVNGMFVNDERVHGRRRLEDGDRIRLHEYGFLLRLGDDPSGEDRTLRPAATAAAPAVPDGNPDATVLLHPGPAQPAEAADLDKTVLLRPGSPPAEASGGDTTVPLWTATSAPEGDDLDKTVLLRPRPAARADADAPEPEPEPEMDKTVILTPGRPKAGGR